MASGWLQALRVYLGVIAFANLGWESMHLPLYTIWRTGTVREKLFAVLHCTGGDVLIALSALVLALLLVGVRQWPAQRFNIVAGLAILFGVAYTIFSEWLNVHVRHSWAYGDWMPVVFGIGLTPVLQWMFIPTLAFWTMRAVIGRVDHEPQDQRRP